MESPKLGKFINIPFEQQDSTKFLGSARDLNEVNSIDSVRGANKSR